MTNLLAGLIFGVAAKSWLVLLAASISTAMFLGWWRIFFAYRRLLVNGSGPQLIRDARNLALCSHARNEAEAVDRILNYRELPPQSFGIYFAAFWFELMPMLILGAVVFAVRMYLLGGISIL